MRRVPKCFRPSRFGDRERAGTIGKFQAVFDLCAANELVDESRVKRIARADGIDNIHYRRIRGEFFLPNAGHSALRATLDYQDADLLRKGLDRFLDVIHLRQLA